MHPLSHPTVNKLCADMTGFYLQVRMSDSGKHKESNADRVKAGPIKYVQRQRAKTQPVSSKSASASAGSTAHHHCA